MKPEVRPFKDQDLSGCLQMTYPSYEGPLHAASSDPSLFALVVENGDGPIGLALARRDVDKTEAEVLSIFIEREYRNQGLGSILLTSIEKGLSDNGCHQLRLVYNETTESALSMARVLEKCGWSRPEPRMLLVEMDRKILEAPWLVPVELPSSLTLFPWADLTESDRSSLEQSLKSDAWIPEYLWPFQYENGLETCNSLGLRCQDGVVGWLLTHRIAPKVIRYTVMCIHPDHRHHGLSFVALAMESAKRQAEHVGLDSSATIGIWAENTRMIEIARSRLAPHAKSFGFTRISKKLFPTRSTGSQKG